MLPKQEDVTDHNESSNEILTRECASPDGGAGTVGRGTLPEHYRVVYQMLTSKKVERRFKCNFCSVACISRADFKRHVLTHSGERPYHCQFCPKTFVREWNLMVHVRTHTGERPYECSLCPRSFSRSDKLKKHLIVVHKQRNLGGRSSVPDRA